MRRISTVAEVNRGSTFALRRSTLDFCLGGQRSCKGNTREHFEFVEGLVGRRDDRYVTTTLQTDLSQLLYRSGTATLQTNLSQLLYRSVTTTLQTYLSQLLYRSFTTTLHNYFTEIGHLEFVEGPVGRSDEQR